MFDGLGANLGLSRYGPVVHADWLLFGVDCGQPFMPLNIRPHLGGYPYVGEPWGVAASFFSPSAAVVTYLLGTSTTAWGPVPLPADLRPLGMAGCQLLVSIDASFGVPVVANAAPLIVAIPNNASLIGARLHWQALAQVAGPTSWGTSGGLTMIIGAR